MLAKGAVWALFCFNHKNRPGERDYKNPHATRRAPCRISVRCKPTTLLAKCKPTTLLANSDRAACTCNEPPRRRRPAGRPRSLSLCCANGTSAGGRRLRRALAGLFVAHFTYATQSSPRRRVVVCQTTGEWHQPERVRCPSVTFVFPHAEGRDLEGPRRPSRGKCGRPLCGARRRGK